jgi:pyruvate kinase
VPAIQKRVIALCNQTHRPVITATQMLDSMERSSRPTRAEASDVFNAVLDGTDAVMLSGETAVGAYPAVAVSTMRQICSEAEAFQKSHWRTPTTDAAASLTDFVNLITESAVDAACAAARRLDAPLIVVATESGRTALALSNRRPPATILALTRDEAVARTLSLCWGVTAAVMADGLQPEQQLRFASDWSKTRGLIRSGQRVVLLRGKMPGQGESRAVFAGEVA